MVWPPEPSKRKVRSNQMQLHMLVDYMSKHRRFAKGIEGGRGPFGMKKVYKQWDNLRIILSQYGPKKSIEQWRHTWRDLRKKARDEAMKRQSGTSEGDMPFERKFDLYARVRAILEDQGPDSPSDDSDIEVSDDQSASTFGVEPRIANDKLHIEVVVKQEQSQEEDNHKPKEGTSSNASTLPYKIAVIPEGFPNKQFKGDGWTAFTPIMFMKLEESTELPKVDVEGIVAGAIHISCNTKSDVEWVFSNLNGEIVDDRKVKVVNVSDLPKPIKMSWQTRNYVITDNSRVLRLMQRAHPVLRTSGWKVEEVIVEEGLIRRIVLMDKISADYIKSMGYKLNNGMCTDDFKVLDNSLDFSEDEADDGVSSNCNKSRRLEQPGLKQQYIVEPKKEMRTPSPVIQVWLEPRSGLLTVGDKSHQEAQPLQHVSVLSTEPASDVQ